MTDFDLERLGDVWRQQPDPAEMERLHRTAAAVSRRARLTQIVDIGVSLVVAGVVLVLVLSNPQSDTVLMGGAAIAVLLYGHFRQRRLRQVELRSLTGGTEDMLDQSIERVGTTLKHNRLTLIGLGPCLVVGILVAATAEARRGDLIISAIHEVPLLRIMWIGGTVAVLAGFTIFLTLALRRGRSELERLVAMREAYRHEHESSAS